MDPIWSNSIKGLSEPPVVNVCDAEAVYSAKFYTVTTILYSKNDYKTSASNVIYVFLSSVALSRIYYIVFIFGSFE